jgi:polysaccharide pyruvyl transferase WcaK-like protein
MRYGGWRDDPGPAVEIFRNYIGKLARFLIWLLERGYCVRVLTGDTGDQPAVDILLKSVAEIGYVIPPQSLFVQPTHSLHDLMHEIAMVDIVVATRFHNVVCALKLCKPTISLGYADKNALLLADMELGEFSQHIADFDLDLLCRQFISLISNRSVYEQRIRNANRTFQLRLDQQDAALAARLHGDVRRIPTMQPPSRQRSTSGSVDRG